MFVQHLSFSFWTRVTVMSLVFSLLFLKWTAWFGKTFVHHKLKWELTLSDGPWRGSSRDPCCVIIKRGWERGYHCLRSDYLCQSWTFPFPIYSYMRMFGRRNGVVVWGALSPLFNSTCSRFPVTPPSRPKGIGSKKRLGPLDWIGLKITGPAVISRRTKAWLTE